MTTLTIDGRIPLFRQPSVVASAARLKEAKAALSQWQTKFDACRADLGLAGQSSSATPEQQFQARLDIADCERESGRAALAHATAARAHEGLVQLVRTEILKGREATERAALAKLKRDLEQARESNAAFLEVQAETELLIGAPYPRTLHWREFVENESGESRYDQWLRFLKSEGKL